MATVAAVTTMTTMTTMATVAAVAAMTTVTTVATMAAVAAAIIVAAAAAAVASFHARVGGDQSDTNDGQEDGNAENQSTIHPRYLHCTRTMTINVAVSLFSAPQPTA